MSKVVIERPRRKSWDRSPSVKTGRRIQRYDENKEYDDLPTREKYSMGWQGGKSNYKCFSDLLGPLYRYLRSNVGRPWDKVYSEMCEHLDFRKTTGRHIFEHVQRYVSLHCTVGEDGKIYELTGWRPDIPVEGLYVHPRTGLLCWKGSVSAKKKVQAKLAALPVTCIPLGGDQYHIQLHGIWYVAKLAALSWSEAEGAAARGQKPELFECFPYNPKLKKIEYYGWGGPHKRHYQILSKRQLSAKELRAAKLSNEVA
ncbi:MAG: hypothetical protein U0Y68_25320 [Blastocatellia bacterium]